jgi:DNA (cytosine-5)-methyltransferase 1
MTFKALDLFAGAGGVSVGLQRAGFEVTGVDIRPQPHYRGGTFIQADAMTYPLEGFDLIWASPPCQAYSSLRFLCPGKEYPDLMPAVRERLAGARGVLTIIENVPGAPLRAPILLCGSMFGLRVQRHRLFELNFFTLAPCCNHGVWQFDLPVSKSNYRRGRRKSRVVGVYGGTQKNQPDSVREAAMGVDWMNRRELTQAIPPPYAEFLGTQALGHLSHR